MMTDHLSSSLLQPVVASMTRKHPRPAESESRLDNVGYPIL
jgi:hypothetical protein